LTFSGNSIAIFDNDLANNGGALFTAQHPNMTFNGCPVLTFNDNNVRAIYAIGTTILFSGALLVTFYKSTEGQDGGALYSIRNSVILFTEDSSKK